MIKKAQEQPPRLIDLSVVSGRTRKCKTAIYGGIKEGSFPPPIRVGKRRVAWLEADVDNWIRKQVERSRAEVA